MPELKTVEKRTEILVSSAFACQARFASWRIHSERSKESWLREEQHARSA